MPSSCRTWSSSGSGTKGSLGWQPRQRPPCRLCRWPSGGSRPEPRGRVQGQGRVVRAWRRGGRCRRCAPASAVWQLPWVKGRCILVGSTSAAPLTPHVCPCHGTISMPHGLGRTRQPAGAGRGRSGERRLCPSLPRPGRAPRCCPLCSLINARAEPEPAVLERFVTVLLDIVLSCQADVVPQVGAAAQRVLSPGRHCTVMACLGLLPSRPSRLGDTGGPLQASLRRRPPRPLDLPPSLPPPLPPHPSAQVRWAQQLHRLLRVHRRKLK